MPGSVHGPGIVENGTCFRIPDRSYPLNDEVAAIRLFLNETVQRMIDVASELSDDELHWSPPTPDGNSVAVLLAHTTGSIEETIVQVMSGEAVNRDRDAEFVERDTSAVVLAEQWAALAVRLEPVFAAIDADQLNAVHQHPRRGDVTGRNVVIGALAHAREHLGQAELIRDLIHAARS